MRAAVLGVAAALAWVCVSSPARAEDPPASPAKLGEASAPDAARAEELFDAGRSLRGAGRILEACAAFEESRRLDEGIGVTLYLADCHEQAGDRGRALREFRRAEALAVARGDARAV